MNRDQSSRLEVLAPAGSMDALVAAVRCGADAVYLGQKNFSARKNSQNFDEETLTEAVRYAHRCGVKIHQALNIIVFEQELAALKECIHAAVRAGVDAMIVQDWGVAALVREYAPDMPLHASTQMAIHSPAGAKLAEELGFSRVVLARELSRKEIERCVQSTPLETEIFVHGAHCMSISGQCYLSAAIGGKSGNRGQCAQPCRLPFQAGSEGMRKCTGENVPGCGHILFGAEAEHRFIPLTCKIAVGKAAPGEHRLQSVQVGRFAPQRLLTGRDGGRHIFRPLHPSLDLDRSNAHLLDLAKL